MGSSGIRSSAPVEARLRQLAAGLLKQPPAELRELPPDFVGAQLEWLLAYCTGAEEVEDGTAASTLVIRRLLLDELRSALLSTWDGDGHSAAEIVNCLLQLDRTRSCCQPRDEEAFAAELADQGGLNLVVEVAHDMRSPLTSILFLAELLHKGQSGALNDVQKHQIGIIYSAALGLENIASDMIEAARGGQRLSPENAVPFSVNDVMDAVVSLVRPMAEEKGLSLSLRPLRSPLRVGQPVPLSRVLLNLCSNGLKFAQDGGIELSARSAGPTAVEFSVTDTGPGIAPEAHTTLFQPFRRDPGRASGYVFSGTGLGLAICRRLVAAMGSELKFEPAPTCGTRFWFVLELPPAELL